MPRNHKQEFEFLNEKCSSLDVRGFVFNAFLNDGVGIVNYLAGKKVVFNLNYITEFPALGEIISKKEGFLDKVLREQAEKLVSERRKR